MQSIGIYIYKFTYITSTFYKKLIIKKKKENHDNFLYFLNDV